MIRMDWTKSMHKPGTDYPIFSSESGSSPQQKPQHGKCHEGEMPDYDVDRITKYLQTVNESSVPIEPHKYNMIRSLYNDTRELNRRKYYDGFSHRREPPTWRTRISPDNLTQRSHMIIFSIGICCLLIIWCSYMSFSGCDRAMMSAHGASVVSHIKSNTVNNEVIPFQIWAFGDAGYDQPCLWKAWNERHGVTYPLFP